jgi:hypothetical protein
LEPVLAKLRIELEGDDTLEPDDRANIQADLDSAEYQRDMKESCVWPLD